MDFSPADLFRSTKTGSRSSLDRVNKQLSASRGTFRQKVHIGVLLATWHSLPMVHHHLVGIAV